MLPDPNYRILPGGSFRMPDGSVKTADDEIYLDADVADLHPGKVEKLPVESAPATDAPAAAADAHQE